MRWHWVLVLGAASVLASCQGKRAKEGVSLCTKLCNDLEAIETREDLAEAQPYLRKDFDALATLVIEWERRDEMHPISPELAERLHADLERVYRMEGGKEVIERSQREALLRMDRALQR